MTTRSEGRVREHDRDNCRLLISPTRSSRRRRSKFVCATATTTSLLPQHRGNGGNKPLARSAICHGLPNPQSRDALSLFVDRRTRSRLACCSEFS